MRVALTFVLAAIAATCSASSSIPSHNKMAIVTRSPKEVSSSGKISEKCGGICDGGPWSGAFQSAGGFIGSYPGALTFGGFGAFATSFQTVTTTVQTTVTGWGATGLGFDPFLVQLQSVLLQYYNTVSFLSTGCGICGGGIGVGGFGSIFTSFLLQIQTIIQICTTTFGGFLGQLSFVAQMLTVIIRLVIGVAISTGLNIGGLCGGIGLNFGTFTSFGIQLSSMIGFTAQSCFTTGFAGYQQISAFAGGVTSGFGGAGGIGGGVGGVGFM